MRSHGLWRWFGATIVSAGMIVLGAAPLAQAAFTPPYTAQCSGSEVLGTSTGLQSNVAQQWALQFEAMDTTSPLACAHLGPRIRYANAIQTNSEGLEVLGAATGVRQPSFRIVGGEEPPTLEQWLRIDLGNKVGENSGLIREIPVASTAVVPLVRFPAGCAIPAGEATSDGRFIISNAQLEKVFAGAIATWGELLPDIEASCSSIPITRVVPSVSDGTTFVFKQWLNAIDPARGWPESESMANTTWPNDSGSTATVRSEGGDRSEARLVARTNGAIGFSSLSNARLEGFGHFSPENPEHEAGSFWLSVKNGAGAQVEPTRDPKSGADNVQGANCDNPTFNVVPSGFDTTVTPVWRAVSAAGSKTGWPICTLTYFLAWDDASTVFGNIEEGQAMQRTVKDFLAYVLGPAGQQEAKEGDYSPLPPTILADAQDGQSRVGWNKTPGSKSNAIKTQIESASKHAGS